MTKEYDATPNLGDVLDMMEGYAYDLWDAVFELVDNSFDSFVANKRKLAKKGEDWEVIVTLDNKAKTFRITDNAYGMNRTQLEKALTLAQKNTTKGIIGKYGMGLKTSASWLGKHWTVKTKQLGSNTEYTAVVDIADLKKTKSNKIPITEKPVSDPNLSYTYIEVKNGCRKYGTTTMSATKRRLELAYQKLLVADKFKLSWRGTNLTYTEPKVLVVEQKVKQKGRSKKKKITYDYKIPKFQINGSSISGRYGIYDTTGKQVPHAGLTLFYNKRVILNRQSNKWLEKIFGGAAGDLARQRVFVKLDVELTPNALKTDFLWKEYTIEKLEKELIAQTDKHILDITKVARGHRKTSGTMTGAKKKMSDTDVKKRMESAEVGEALAPAAAAAKTTETDVTKEEVEELKKLDGKPLQISINKGQPVVNVYMGDQHESESFITIKTEPKTILCFINPNHPFYASKIGSDPALYQLYLDICTNIALSKYTADQSGTDVSPSSLISVLDIFLRNTGRASN